MCNYHLNGGRKTGKWKEKKVFSYSQPDAAISGNDHLIYSQVNKAIVILPLTLSLLTVALLHQKETQVKSFSLTISHNLVIRLWYA